MSLSKKKSITFIRAISCIFIFLGHFIDHYQSIEPSNYLLLFSWIGNFGIGMFAFISGYGLSINFSLNISLLTWFKKRLLRIYPTLWTFLFVAIVFYYYFLDIRDFKGTLLFNIIGMDGLFLFGPRKEYPIAFGGTWFISFIIFAYLSFPFIYELFFNQAKILYYNIFVLLTVYFFCVILQIYVGSGSVAFFLCIPCFLGGVFLRLNPFYRSISWYQMTFATILLILLIFFNSLAFYYKKSYFFICLKYFIIPLYPMLFFPIIEKIFNTVKSESHLFRFINFISENSFEIYLYHPLTMRECYIAVLGEYYSAFLALCYAITVTIILAIVTKLFASPVKVLFQRILFSKSQRKL